jgi:undecaprenyl-diphosphatase
MANLSAAFRRIDVAEYRVCRKLNRGAQFVWLRKALVLASRLGDGPAWYALMLALPLLYGARGARVALIMLAAAAIGLALYKWLKQVLVRERPFIRHAEIDLGTAPLDRYSFPSGHTLHAVAFSWQAIGAFPELAGVLVPFALAVAASRVVLGLHYPTDVAAGAAIGAGLGGLGYLLQ